jgi:hypothetical protein
VTLKRNPIRILVRIQYSQELRAIANQLGLEAKETPHPTMEKAVYFEFKVTEEEMADLESRVPADFHARRGIVGAIDSI